MAVQAITVYKFFEAPEKLRELSEFDGQETWLAHVSLKYEDHYWIAWLEEGHFAPRVQKFELEDGTAVYIGATE